VLVLYSRGREGNLFNMQAIPFSFIQGVGGPELLIILLIILLLFGAKKLPELAKGLGKSMKEFKKATQEVQDDFQEAMDSVDPKEDEQEKKKNGKNEETTAPASQDEKSS
jgi:sec-independent protein translocase protein TatA